ncbi:MAG: DUF134 domain-containing protein [bacterium]|nr:DUF134 domain-containing protein [bacterium]
MARPLKCRKIYIDIETESYCFGPKRVPMKQLEKVALTLDELQAVKFADLEGVYHENAGKRMGISRQTFSNLVKSARKKIADAIINQKVLIIEDSGNTVVAEKGFTKCRQCCHEWGSVECIKKEKSCSILNNGGKK